MNTSVIIVGVITLLLIWLNLWVSIKIIDYLKSKGEDVSLFNGGFFVRGKIFKYLPLYKKVTLEIDGKVGPLYNTFYLTFILFMFSLGVGIIMVL
jgi:hypothetical protein